VLVSTGFQRSFFSLIFSNHDYCKGLVICDINPQIIACAHFNILLLRVATDRKDYKRLSNSDDCLLEIIDRVAKAVMPEKFRKFYLKNFFKLASLYYEASTAWKNDERFRKVCYHEKKRQFTILQSYAKNGNIIATVRSIEDLRFLSFHEIVVIDSSNIQDYTMLDIQCVNLEDAPTVIWTQLNLKSTQFYSEKHFSLSNEERSEMDELLNLIASTTIGRQWNKKVFACVFDIDNSSSPLFGTYSRKTLEDVRAFVREWLIYLPPIGFVNFSSTSARLQRVFQLNQLTKAQCKRISKAPGIEKYVEQLVAHWGQLEPNIYYAFSNIPGWEAAFLRLCEKKSDDQYFMDRFKTYHLFQKFQNQIR
jgi:hypothetical protein